MTKFTEKTKNLFESLKTKAEQAELIGQQSESSSILFENDEFKKIEASNSEGVGLRVIQNGKLGFSFSNNLNDSNLMDRSLKSAEFGEKALFSFVSHSEKNGDLSIYDEKIEAFPISEMIRMGREIIEPIKKTAEKLKVEVHIAKETHHNFLQTSKGFLQDYKKSYFSIYAGAVFAEEGEILSLGRGKTRSHSFEDTKEISDSILEHWKQSRRKAKIQTGNYPVLFTPKSVRTLVSILSASFNGKNIQKGISPLSEKLGEQIVSKEIRLVDRGNLKQGIATVPFDGEGTPTQENILIQEGKANAFIFDLQTASLTKTQSTGNASRGYSSLPNPSFRNLILSKEKNSKNTETKNSKDYESLLALVKKEGLLVEDFIGAGQSNVLAGEFSMNLALAFKIERGELVGRLKDTMMSGNVFNVLNQILAMGDTVFQEGSGWYPYLLLDSLSISAKGSS